MHDTNDVFVFPTSETMEPGAKTGTNVTTGAAWVEPAREWVRGHPLTALAMAVIGGFLMNRFSHIPRESPLTPGL